MLSMLLILSAAACAHGCYWNNKYPYPLFATLTPYALVRGDIKDFAVPQNCKAVSIWTLNRHGNSNPKMFVLTLMKNVALLKDEIIASHEAGRGQLCAQDITNLRKWTWNSTMEVFPEFLTGTGYEEIYGIASRIRKKYPHLLQGVDSDYYIRPSNLQRTISSAVAFTHGLSKGRNTTLPVEEAWERDNVINPQQYCDRYEREVRENPTLKYQLDAYYETAEYIVVQQAVQRRLGITTQLTPQNIFALYELCRFDRYSSKTLQSPWCAVFSTSDLMVLEYRDDLRKYYINGYGSWINVKLGAPLLKDLYENFLGVTQGQSRKITSYLTRSTVIGMVWSAMGIYKDPDLLDASFRNPHRAWRMSHINPGAGNMIAVLNTCQESGNQTYRVQFFINEKETEICPLRGCTWEEFQDKFQRFTEANLDFCSMD